MEEVWPSKLFLLSVITSIAARLSLVWESFWAENHPVGDLQQAGLEALSSLASCCISVAVQLCLGSVNTLKKEIALGNNIVGAVLHLCLYIRQTTPALIILEVALSVRLLASCVCMGYAVEAVSVNPDSAGFFKLFFENFYMFIKGQKNIVTIMHFLNSLALLAVEFEEQEMDPWCVFVHGTGALLLFGALLRLNWEALQHAAEVCTQKVRELLGWIVEKWSWFLLELKNARDLLLEKGRAAGEILLETLAAARASFMAGWRNARDFFLENFRVAGEIWSSVKAWILAEGACFKADNTTRRLEV